MSEYLGIEKTFAEKLEEMKQKTTLGIASDCGTIETLIDRGLIDIGDLNFITEHIIKKRAVDSTEEAKWIQAFCTQNNVRIECPDGSPLSWYEIAYIRNRIDGVNRKENKRTIKRMKKIAKRGGWKYIASDPLVLSFYLDRSTGTFKLGCYNAGNRIRAIFDLYRVPREIPEDIAPTLKFAILLNVPGEALRLCDTNKPKTADDRIDIMGIDGVDLSRLRCFEHKIQEAALQSLTAIASSEGVRKPGQVYTGYRGIDEEKVNLFGKDYFEAHVTISAIAQCYYAVAKAQRQLKYFKAIKQTFMAAYFILEQFGKYADTETQTLIKDVIQCLVLCELPQLVKWESEIGRHHSLEIINIIRGGINKLRAKQNKSGSAKNQKVHEWSVDLIKKITQMRERGLKCQ
jgi:hypothetical protein